MRKAFGLWTAGFGFETLPWKMCAWMRGLALRSALPVCLAVILIRNHFLLRKKGV